MTISNAIFSKAKLSVSQRAAYSIHRSDYLTLKTLNMLTHCALGSSWMVKGATHIAA